MKPQFTFGFIDEPQYRTQATRQQIANMLRAYRCNPVLYRLTRLGLHRYSVVVNPWNDSASTAVIETV